MTALSGAFDKACLDGNTILLEVGIENGKTKYVYIGGDMVCSFMTSENIYLNMFLIWEIICLLIVLLQVKKITICWLRILVLLKRIRLITMIY